MLCHVMSCRRRRFSMVGCTDESVTSNTFCLSWPIVDYHQRDQSIVKCCQTSTFSVYHAFFIRHVGDSISTSYTCTCIDNQSRPTQTTEQYARWVKGQRALCLMQVDKFVPKKVILHSSRKCFKTTTVTANLQYRHLVTTDVLCKWHVSYNFWYL